MRVSPEERVAKAFRDSLAHIGFHAVRVDANDVAVGCHRAWRELHLWITFRVDPDDAGFPNLEFYAHDSMGDDYHGRIWADGHREELDAMRLWVRLNPDVPGSKSMALEANRAYNFRVAERLRARGLFPEGEASAIRRAGGASID